MSFVAPPPLRRFMWRSANSMLAALLLAGCQSYEPAPLDMNAFDASLDTRLLDTEPVAEFARRLDEAGDDVPLVFDPADGISYAEGEVLALFYNPDLRIARLEAGVALAIREYAGLWEDPVFGFDGAEIISPSKPFEYGLMGSFTIPISGRLEVEKDRAGALYEAQLRRVVDAEWRTRAALRRHWSTWTAAVERARLLEEMTGRLQRIEEIAEHMNTSGELNRVEHRLLRIELADLEVRTSEQELDVLVAEAALLEVMGLGPDAARLLQPAFPDIALPDVKDVTTRLIESNTELAVLFADYQVAEDTLRLEIRKQFPDIVFGSGYGTEFNDRRVMFGVSIPIPILNANQSSIAEARAQREVMRARAETAFARLDRSLAAAVETLEVKGSQREQYEQEVLPLLSDQDADLDRIAALGELDLFILMETMTRMLDTKQRLIALRAGEIDVTITAHRILGPGTRQFPLPTEGGSDPDAPSPEHAGEAGVGGTK
ncbi:MAG: TolC family protein [Phycisphaerales bacterium]|nr:TolC family protein [Phycisphaerales bacterium]